MNSKILGYIGLGLTLLGTAVSAFAGVQQNAEMESNVTKNFTVHSSTSSQYRLFSQRKIKEAISLSYVRSVEVLKILQFLSLLES